MGYALDLLDNKNAIPTSFVGQIYNPILCGTGGVAAFSFANFMSRRPLLSGIHRHAIALVGGVIFGIWINKKRDEYYAEKDAVLRHYVELHPEDFPDPERKKYKEIFQRWQPIR